MGGLTGILGKKLGMTQVFTDDGDRVPVTVIEAGPCVVTAMLTPEKNGYAAVQLGYDPQKKSRVNRPDLTRFDKASVEPQRFVREIRVAPEDLEGIKVGQTVTVSDVFSEGDIVDVTGISKGKGFQGVMRKFGFSGFKATHGTAEFFRHGGSIGCRLTPGRVVKGKSMPGQLGNRKVTVQNLRVAGIRPDDNLLLVKGAVPGARTGYVMVRPAIKKHAGAPEASNEASNEASK